MKYLHNIGSYFLMIGEMFRKPTKWSVMKHLILKDVEDLIISSIGIVAFIAFFVGGVVTIQTALNTDSPLLPKYLVGFATRQSIILEFAPTFISVIMASPHVRSLNLANAVSIVVFEGLRRRYKRIGSKINI